MTNAEKLDISRNRVVTYENDREGVALDYALVGNVVRKTVDYENMNAPMFDDDWAEEIADYHEFKLEKRD